MICHQHAQGERLAESCVSRCQGVLFASEDALNGLGTVEYKFNITMHLARVGQGNMIMCVTIVLGPCTGANDLHMHEHKYEYLYSTTTVLVHQVYRATRTIQSDKPVPSDPAFGSEARARRGQRCFS